MATLLCPECLTHRLCNPEILAKKKAKTHGKGTQGGEMKADKGSHKGIELVREDGTYQPGMKNDRTQ